MGLSCFMSVCWSIAVYALLDKYLLTAQIAVDFCHLCATPQCSDKTSALACTRAELQGIAWLVWDLTLSVVGEVASLASCGSLCDPWHRLLAGGGSGFSLPFETSGWPLNFYDELEPKYLFGAQAHCCFHDG